MKNKTLTPREANKLRELQEQRAEQEAEQESVIRGIKTSNKRTVAWIERMMRRRARHWTKAQVYALQSPGTFCVHPNLYLKVYPDGARRWSYRFMHKKKPHEIGLGALPYVGYHDAVLAVATLREWRDDPVETRKQARKLMRDRRSKWREYDDDLRDEPMTLEQCEANERFYEDIYAERVQDGRTRIAKLFAP